MNDKNKKTWAALVKIAARHAMQGRKPFDGAVALYITFLFTRPSSHYGTGRNAKTLRSDAPQWHTHSPDLDKLVRCLGDAMTGVVYEDDRQVCSITCDREWALYGDCRAVVEVQPLEQNQS